MSIPTFLKWAGGKRRLISQIDPYLPFEVNRYFEPFLGGGSMFFYIKQKYNPKYCEISDINKDLIDTFVSVRDQPEELTKQLAYFKKRNSKKFYYETREKFNENKLSGLKRAAAFIYLNKTCFNGIYRVNSKGKFNVPYGRYTNPEIFSKETILSASKLLQNVTIKCQSYEKILSQINRGDLVYLDPCYDPLKRTSFANYTPKRFSLTDRTKLSNFMNSLKKKEAFAILSNNNIKKVEDIYRNNGFNIHKIQAARSVNSNPLGRGKITELLITT